jgi:hypothetical protein
MKAVVVHSQATQDEKNWANQFAGLDPVVKGQFSAVDWAIRVARVFTINGFTWDAIVSTVSDAARAAGTGGVVIVASGHGGAVFENDPNGDGGMINFDPTDADVDMDWTSRKIRKGLFWDDMVARYLDPIPMGNPPNQKAIDERDIAKKGAGWELIQKRHDAFEALDKIGQALKDSGVARLTFTVCTAGRARGFMNRLAKLSHTEVACFKEITAVFNDDRPGYGQNNGGKARLTLNRDFTSGPGHGTNTLSARVFSPNLDDTSIAFVGRP